MNSFAYFLRVQMNLLRRAVAIAATIALVYMPMLAYVPAAYATDYTGGNGGSGGNGSYSNSTGSGVNAGGGSGGGNGNGGSASSGGGNSGYSSSNPGGNGGAADSAGSGGQNYSYGGSGGGGGAGGAGYVLSDGSTLAGSGNVTGGNGGNGGSGGGSSYPSQYAIGGGGGGGGGGSGILVLGSGSITNSEDILGGTGGFGASTYYHLNPDPHQDGQNGAGGHGINAANATGLTIDNSGNITGGDAGYSPFVSYQRLNVGGAGIYGQNITLNNTGGTIKGGAGNAIYAAGIELTGGTNTLNLSGGTIASGDPGDAIKIDAGTNTIKLEGASIAPDGGGTGIEVAGGTNVFTLSSGGVSTKTSSGGGLIIGGSSSNTFTMTGGFIAPADDTQDYMPAIKINSGSSTFDISAGTLNGGYQSNIIQLYGGTNTFNISGTASLTGNYVGDAIVAGNGVNTFNISGGTVLPSQYGAYAINTSGGTNIINVTGGTVGKIYLGGGTNTLEGGGFSDIVTLASGATGKIIAAGSDVSGITTFDNFGGLTIDSGRSLTVSTFTNESSGTLTLNSGAQLIASTLNLLDGSTIAGAGTLSSGATPLTLGSGSVSATVGGTGGLVKSGTGTLTLTGANTYTGGTTVNGGTLSIADGALGGGDVTLAEGTTIQFTGSSFTTTNDFHITGDPVFDVASGTTQTVSGVIDDATGPTDPGVVEKTSAGTLVLSGANTYSGGTTIEAGTLQIGTDSVFNTPGDPTSGIVSSAIGTGTLTFGGGTLQAGVDTIIANAIDLNTADGTIDANGHDISLTGLISGTHGLSIASSSGGGAVTFANTSNSISAIVVSGSGLRISESGNGDFGSGLVTLGDGTGITFTAAGTYTNNVTVSGDPTFDTGGNIVTYGGSIADGGTAGDVEVTGGGTLILTNVGNSYTGGTVVFDGSTVSIDSDGELGGAAGGVTLGDATTTGTLAITQNITSARTVTLNAGGGIFALFGETLTLSGQVTGSGGFTVASPGSVFLRNATNNYSGGTTIASGSVIAGAANVFGTGAIAIKAAGLLDLNNNSQSIPSLSDGGDVHGGAIRNSDAGTAVLTIGSDNSNSAFSGVIEEGISVTKAGTGTLVLSGANTYTGGTTIDAGILQVGVDTVGSHGAITSSAIGMGALTLDGGTLQFGGAYTIANDIAVGTNSGTIDANGYFVQLRGDITGSTGITFADSGAGRSFTVLSGNNTYSGTTTIASGTVDLASATALSANSDYDVIDGGAAGGAGELDMNGFSGTIRSLAGNAGGQIYNGGADATLTIAPASGTTTFAGTIADAGAGHALTLVMNGAPGSKEILSGANTYAGGTTISGGILGVGSNTALGTGTVTLNSGTLQAEGVYVVANAIDIDANGGTIDANDKALYLNGGIGNGTNGNTGTLTFADMSGLNTGVIVLESASTYSGAVVIDSGVAVGEGGGNMLPGGAYTVNGTLYSLGPQTISSLTGSGRVVGLYGGGPLSVNQASGTSTFSGTLDDDGLNPLSLVKNGAGTLNLSGTNTFTGGTTLNAGTLGALNSSALGTGGVTLNGGTLVYGNTVNIANAITLAGDAALEVDGTDSATQSGVIDDNGSAHTLQKLGSGTLTLSGANTYSGTTQLTAGTLEIGNAAALGSSTLLFDGGTLKAGSGYTIANAIDIDATGGTIDANGHSLYLYGAIGNGTNGNTGTLTFADMSGANTGVIGLESASTYSGAVVIGSGVTVAEGGANMLPGGAYTVNGTLDIIGAQTISGLTGSGSVVGYFGGGLLSVNQASGTSTFSGTLDDNGLSPIVLEKSGAGIMNLSGANTFTGGTILDAGTIGALNSAALGTGGITFNGGTLLYANTVNIANAITLAGDAALEVDGADSAIQSGAIGDAGSARTLQKLGTGTLQLTQANTYSGTTKLTAGTLEIGDAGGLGSSTLLFDGGTLKVDGAYTIANDIDLDANGGTFDTNGYDTDLTGTLSSGSTDGALTIAGTGSFKVSGLNNLSGGAVLDANAQMEVAGASGMGAGDVSMNAGSAIHFTTTSGTFTNRFLLDGTASFDVDSGLTTTLNNAIADAPSAGSPGVLVKTGAGTLALSGANTYSGGTILTDGILRLDAGTDSNGVSPLGTGTVTFNGGTLQAGGDYTYANSLNETGGGTIDANGHQLSLTGSIVGSTNLTFADSQGGGAVAVTGHNFFNGNVTIDHATVILTGINSGTGVGPLGIGTTTLDGGTLLSEQSGFIDNQIALGADGGTLRATEPNGFGFGPISDAVAGAGPLTIGAPGDTGVVSLSDGSTYTGGTIIAGGTLRALGGTSVLGDASGTVEMKSGTTLDLENATVVANTLILDDTTPTLEVSGGTSTINGGVQELSGTPGGFTKTGTGTLVLAGANNYSGGTSIAAGTLELGSALSVVSAGTYDVASGASLDIDSSLGSVYIGALSGAGSLTAFSGTNLNVGGVGLNSDDTTFSGVINADYLAYDGLGTLTLSGTGSNIKQLMVCGCTNSGGITLSGGSLTAAIGVGVSGQTFTVANGAQLTTPDFEQGGGTVTIMGANTAVDTTNSGAGLIAIYTTVARTPVFTISDGAQVAGDTLLSGLSGGTVAPQITVTGANTLLSLTSGAQLNDGTSLTVVDGATLTAPSIDLDTNATLTIGAGAAAGTVGDASTRIQGLSSGTQLVANFTGNATLDAFITGALGLNLQSGNLTLTNAQNDYSGGTTIASNAVLILQDSPAGTGAIADAGVLAISNSSASTFGYNLSGPGGLAQIGDGALTINTAQVYAGGTVIAPNSTLFLAGAGDLSHSSGIEADGTFDISGVTASSVGITKLFGDGDVEIGSKTLVVAGNGGVFSGILSDGGDHGGLTVLGDQVLNGVISLTGTTTIGAGATLTVSGPNALGGSALDFKAGSTLKFGGSGTYTNTMMFDTGAPVFDVTNQSVTLSGVLDGPGDLAVTGANGTLTLTNTGNTYAGGTEVYGNATLNVGADSELGAVAALQLGDSSTKGTLQYGASFALNNARAITLNAGGSAIDTNGFDATIASTIGGAGGLAKLGTGTLTLTGTNTYSGATTVTAGVLQVNGSIASSAVIVASGGTLSGSGTVGATSVAGTIAPNGNTLHVGGALSLANGATTAIAVTPTTSGQIAATGSASLDGVLAITQGAGTYTGGTSFQLISASSVMGTFDSVTGTSFTGLDSSVVYSATGVELDLATPASSGGSGSGSGAGSGSGSGGGGVVTKFLFGTYGKTANQIAAGKALAAGDPNGALYVAMGNAVKADVAGVPAALGQLSGDIHASVRSAMIEDGRLARDAILDHMQFAEQGTSVWGTGLYSNGGIDSDGNASALHHNSTGFLAGVDMPLGDGFRVGIGAGAISNNASEPGRMSTASGSTGHVLAYGGWSDGTLTLKLGGDYGWGDMDVTRQVAVLPETDKGSRHQSSAQIFSEAAYLFQTDAAQIRPYADLAYISVRTGAFTEKGGVSALSGGARDDDATYATLGVRFSLAEVKLDDTRIVPKLGIGWQHAFDRFSPEQVLTLQNAAQDFTVQGVPLKSDAAVVQAGIGIVLSPDVVLDVGYDGAFSAASRDHGLRGELRWTF